MKTDKFIDIANRALTIKYEDIYIPEFEDSVRIKKMDGNERRQYDSNIFEVKGTKLEFKDVDMRSLLLSLTLCDDEGNRMFNPADMPIISKISSDILERLSAVARKINGFDERAQEEMEKN